MKTHGADHIQMTIPAKSEYVGVVRLTVSGVANRLRFTYDDIEDMKIAVAEACTNVVNHAYRDEGLMNISFYLHDDRIEIVVSDQGKSFDIEGLRGSLGPINVDKPIAELKEGGLGLFLIDTLMDKVEIHDESGVIIIMTKFLQRDEVGQDADRFSSAQSEQSTNICVD